ncbi:MAG: hypothetical protein MUF80_10350 [Burkholderiales bacterium]|nr:hypothetical protein [Burkholderiales bacterium]
MSFEQSELRVPTMSQLSRLGVDAGRVLDAKEEKIWQCIDILGWNSPRKKSRLRARLRRLRQRRVEFFGGEFGGDQ